ncbi:RNA polymerase sigma-70 factor, ECF subfamily [Candidatus Magnetomoraceae bacterium gMMP-15]
MKGPSEEDRQLLSGCATGDNEALESLFRKYSNLVYHYVRHILAIRNVPYDEEELKELHNTVFLQLYDQQCKKLRQYEGKNGCSLASWIRLITVRTVLNQLRKKSIDIAWRKQRIPLNDAPPLFGNEVDGFEFTKKSERQRLVKEGLKKLGNRDRLFLKLHIEKGFPVPEVATIMNISEANAHTIKHRAIQRLKSLIKKAIKD